MFAQSNRFKRKRVLIWLVTGVVFGSIGFFWLWKRMNGPIPFDQQAWLRAEQLTDKGKDVRLRMADGLISSKVLLGKDRTQAELMLGPPTGTNKFQNNDDSVYWLGPERGLISIDSEWLVLRYGVNGTVSEAWIARD